MKLYSNPRPRADIDINELRQLRAQGYTSQQLAEHFGVSRPTIASRLKRDGLTLADITPERATVEDIKRLASEGLTQQEIAEHFGVSVQTIISRLRAEGLFMRDIAPLGKTHTKSYVTADEIKRLALEGLTQQEIADHFGVTSNTVRDRLRAEGLSIKDIERSARSHRDATTRNRGSRKNVTVEDIKRLASEGLTQRDVAEHFGVSEQTIINRLRAANLRYQDLPVQDTSRRVEQKRLKDQKTRLETRKKKAQLYIPRIKALRLRGLAMDEIADILGVTNSTIRTYLAYEGLRFLDLPRPMRSHQIAQEGRSILFEDIPVDEVKSLRKKGLDITQIAAHFGVSTATVRNRLRDAGLRWKDLPRGNPLQTQGSAMSKTVGFGVGATATTALDYTLKKTTELSSTKRHLISGGTTTVVGLGVYATTKREDALWSAYGSLFATVGHLIYDKLKGK